MDDTGARWTQVTTDTDGIRSAQAIWNSGLHCGCDPPEDTLTATRPGWPLECTLGLYHLANRTTRPASPQPRS
jgi:hypothetical protein